MTDTELIEFLERTESTVSPSTDSRGILTEWIAHCAPLLVTASGKTWRDAVKMLKSEMEASC